MATITASKAQVEATTAWLDLADELDGYDVTATYRLQYAGNNGLLIVSLSVEEPIATQSYRIVPQYGITQVVAQAHVWFKIVGVGASDVQPIMVESDETVVEPEPEPEA